MGIFLGTTLNPEQEDYDLVASSLTFGSKQGDSKIGLQTFLSRDGFPNFSGKTLGQIRVFGKTPILLWS